MRSPNRVSWWLGGGGGAAAGTGLAISRGASIGGADGATAIVVTGPPVVAAGPPVVVAGFPIVGDVGCVSTIAEGGGGAGRTGGTGTVDVAAAVVEAVPDFTGGMVASALSARSKTVVALSRGGGGEVFATSFDCRDDLVDVPGVATDSTGASALLAPAWPEALAALDDSAGACTAAGGGFVSGGFDGHN